MKKDIEKLVMIVQSRVVGIFLVKGFVELIDKEGPYKFSNMRLTKLGESSVANGDLVTDEEVHKYMLLWPAGYRSTLSKVKAKMNRFVNEHECTTDQINLAAKLWLKDKETPYHGKADYFFYKQEKDGEESRCEEYLALVKEKEEDDEDYRNQVT